MEKYLDKTLITGDTYEKKLFIKKYKGQWSPEHKGWLVLNSQNINELKKNLKQLSVQFDYIKYNHNVDGSKKSNVNENLEETSISEYAFIDDS